MSDNEEHLKKTRKNLDDIERDIDKAKQHTGDIERSIDRFNRAKQAVRDGRRPDAKETINATDPDRIREQAEAISEKFHELADRYKAIADGLPIENTKGKRDAMEKSRLANQKNKDVKEMD